jgi:hypothetical protein
MIMTRRLDPELLELLRSSGAEWRIVAGSKHKKILINGRVASILPLNGGHEIGRRDINIRKHIERFLRREKGH